MTFGSDTMLNHLFQKLKLIGRDKFIHLINILTMLYQNRKNYIFKHLLANP